MAYIALYRQWRPGSFGELVGQEAISKTLSRAITLGRLSHAYLFSGPRGTGKTSTAKILAKSLNCEKGPTPEPCGTCTNCRKIADGTSLDVFEIDAASNRGIDEMRDLREKVKFTPAEGRYKIYIIDEVHMLTTEAFNALLKTLEEPPAHVVFILATTEPHKVPATIQSRCQRFDFRRITVEEIVGRLAHVAQEMKIPCDEEALHLIALQADGGMRDALSLLDQCSSLSEDGVTAERVGEILGLVGHAPIYRLTKAIAEKAKGEIFDTVADLLADGKEAMQVLAELVLHLRSLMLYQAAGEVAGLDLYGDRREALEEQKGSFSQEQLMQMIGRLHGAMAELRWTPQPRITLEVALLSLCRGTGEEGRLSAGETKAASSGTEAAPVSAGQASAETARIARLEAELAALKAVVEARPAAAAPAPRRTAPAAGGAVRPAPAARAGAPALSAETGPAVPLTPEGEALHKALLQRLQEAKRAPVLACINGASFAGLADGVFYLRFNSPFLAERTARADYRDTIEKILADLSGEALSLSCIKPQDKPTPPPAPKPKKKPALDALQPLHPAPKRLEIDEAELSPDERRVLQNAVNIFGGDIVDLPEEERIEALAAKGRLVTDESGRKDRAGAPSAPAPPPGAAPSPSSAAAPPSGKAAASPPEATAAPPPEAYEAPPPGDEDAPEPEENS